MATINLTSTSESGFLEDDFDQIKTLVNGKDTNLLTNVKYEIETVSSNATLEVGKAYVLSTSSIIALTLPATASVGDKLMVIGTNVTGLGLRSYIKPNTGDYIMYVAGNIISNSDQLQIYRNIIQFICVEENSKWQILTASDSSVAVVDGVSYSVDYSGTLQVSLSDEYDTDSEIVTKGPITLCTANKGTLLTLTLPEPAYVNQIIKIVGVGAGGWKIAQPSNVTIINGNASSTSGVTGYISSTHARDCVELCASFNDGSDIEWQVISSIGTITIA